MLILCKERASQPDAEHGAHVLRVSPSTRPSVFAEEADVMAAAALSSNPSNIKREREAAPAQKLGSSEAVPETARIAAPLGYFAVHCSRRQHTHGSGSSPGSGVFAGVLLDRATRPIEAPTCFSAGGSAQVYQILFERSPRSLAARRPLCRPCIEYCPVCSARAAAQRAPVHPSRCFLSRRAIGAPTARPSVRLEPPRRRRRLVRRSSRLAVAAA